MDDSLSVGAHLAFFKITYPEVRLEKLSNEDGGYKTRSQLQPTVHFGEMEEAKNKEMEQELLCEVNGWAH